MLPVQHDIRLFDELTRLLGDYDPTVPSAVLAELEGLSDGAGAAGRAATVGHELATERCDRLSIEGESADDVLVTAAREGLVDYVVTTDRVLRDRILETDVSVIALRGSNNLALTHP